MCAETMEMIHKVDNVSQCLAFLQCEEEEKREGEREKGLEGGEG